jgi:DUF4097 and DUF4098 domain-containing protein YvlB
MGALIALAAGAAAAQEQAPEIVVPLSRPGEPAVLEVGVVSGSISVTGYDGDSVIVETTLATPDDGSERETRGGLKRIPNNSVGLTVEERSNKVEISGDWSSRTMKLVVRVPRQTSLHLSTVNNGELEVSGVVGDHELSNVNGGITAMDISGSLVANTTNGDIVARFQSVRSEKAMSFSTWNGKVDLTLPSDVRAKLIMSSGNGDIYTDFEVALQPQAASMSREEGKKGFRVRLEKQVVGTINGGTAELRFKTFNGDIFLRRGGA